MTQASAHERRPSRSCREISPRSDLDALLGAVACGEREAFDHVYELLREPVRRMTRAVLHDWAQAEEVAQEVLLELWSTAVCFDPARGSAMAWVLTIARRRAIDRVRSIVSRVAREDRTADQRVPWDQTYNSLEQDLDREWLFSSLDQLSDCQQAAIMLAFFHGHTYGQVAGILGIPLSTVPHRGVLGPEHPDALAACSNLARWTGEAMAAGRA